MKLEAVEQFKRALSGNKGELDAWLEVHSEDEVSEIFKHILGEPKQPKYMYVNNLYSGSEPPNEYLLSSTRHKESVGRVLVEPLGE